MIIVMLKVIAVVCGSLAIIFSGITIYNTMRIDKELKFLNDIEYQRSQKKEMCERAIIGRVCPGVCDRCAWNWRQYERD